jgi:hypothetical protein
MTQGQFESKFGFPAIIDGDELIAETIGWPKGAWWDDLPRDEYIAFLDRVIDVIGAAAQRSFVVFGVFPPTPEAWVRLTNFINRENVEILGISPGVLQRNMMSRKENLPPGSSKPTDAERSYKSLVHAMDIYGKFSPRSFNYSIDMLPKLFEEYLQLFANGLYRVQYSKDKEILLLDGVVKGNWIRSRLRDGKNEMFIIFSDRPNQASDGLGEILPYQSPNWHYHSQQLRRVKHRHSNRL